jgi:Kelch motif
VCDASRAACVDCVSDVDCPAAQLCTPERMCAPQVCTPGARECLELRRIRTCNTNGSGWVESSCGSGASCVDNRCQAQVCSPGSASCGSMTQRRVCNPDGLGYTPTECAAMESCSLGACRPSWVCTPGAYSCASTAERRVCNADGLGYAPAACPLPPNATATACTTGTCSFTCAAGFGDCDGSTSNGGEGGLLTSTSHCGASGMVCPSGQSCVGRVCTSAPPGSLNTGRYGFGAAAAPVTARVGANAVTAPDGRVFLFGGGTDTTGATATLSVEIYDPVANTWSAGPALTTSRTYAGAVLGTDGRIYIAGGFTGSNYQATATAFAPVAGTYTAIAGLNVSHGYVRLAPLPRRAHPGHRGLQHHQHVPRPRRGLLPGRQPLALTARHSRAPAAIHARTTARSSGVSASSPWGIETPQVRGAAGARE